MLVMAYPKNETGIKYGEDKFKEVEEYNSCMDWYTEGDRLEVWYDTEMYEEAVYRRFGTVKCLLDKFGIYAANDTDDPYEMRIAEVLKDEVRDAGFPTERPAEITWRDLMVRIESLPEDVLDMPALVWVDPANKNSDGECRVTDLSPFDADEPVGEGNRLCIDFR